MNGGRHEKNNEDPNLPILNTASSAKFLERFPFESRSRNIDLSDIDSKQHSMNHDINRNEPC